MNITINDIELTIEPSKRKLPPEVKSKWTEALRSGKYKQGRTKLCANECYCCLGVLSHIQGRLTKNGEDEPYYDVALLSVNNDFHYLNHLNIASNWECIEGYSLAALNDRGVSFSQIADIIDYAL